MNYIHTCAFGVHERRT